MHRPRGNWSVQPIIELTENDQSNLSHVRIALLPCTRVVVSRSALAQAVPPEWHRAYPRGHRGAMGGGPATLVSSIARPPCSFTAPTAHPVIADRAVGPSPNHRARGILRTYDEPQARVASGASYPVLHGELHECPFPEGTS